MSDKIAIISLNSFRSTEAKKSKKGSIPSKAFERDVRETLFRSKGLISFFILEQRQRSAAESAEVRGPVDWLLSDFVRKLVSSERIGEIHDGLGEDLGEGLPFLFRRSSYLGLNLRTDLGRSRSVQLPLVWQESLYDCCLLRLVLVDAA